MIRLFNALTDGLDHISGFVMTTAARVVFAGVLFVYYWNSAKTKVGDGIFGLLSPSDGAYIQIFPKAVEAVSYDTSQLGIFHWLVALAGTWAEFILPVLIVIGLATRLAALGMIGFVVVQSYVDVTGHALAAADIGAWFDANPASLIVDQRALWILLLAILVLRGAGPISADAIVRQSSSAFTSDPQPR